MAIFGNRMIGFKKNEAPSLLLPVDSIISEYKFENNVLDTVGQNNGIPTNITYTAGLVGNAVKFINNNQSEITIGNSTSFDINGNSTISFLFKRTASSMSKGNIFDYGTYRSWGNLQFTSNGQMTFYWTPNVATGYKLMLGGTLILNEWTHVVVRREYNPTEVIRIYRNGILSSVSYSTAAISARQSTGNFYLGEGYVTGNVDGEMDCFRVWGAALTDEYILELATKELSGIDINP